MSNFHWGLILACKWEFDVRFCCIVGQGYLNVEKDTSISNSTFCTFSDRCLWSFRTQDWSIGWQLSFPLDQRLCWSSLELYFFGRVKMFFVFRGLEVKEPNPNGYFLLKKQSSFFRRPFFSLTLSPLSLSLSLSLSISLYHYLSPSFYTSHCMNVCKHVQVWVSVRVCMSTFVCVCVCVCIFIHGISSMSFAFEISFFLSNNAAKRISEKIAKHFLNQQKL